MKREQDIISDSKGYIRFIYDFLEYTLMLAVILDCNTLYCVCAQGLSGEYGIRKILYLLSVTILTILILMNIWSDKNTLHIIRGALPKVIVLSSYAILFFILNVRYIDRLSTKGIFIINFVFFLPAMMVLFQIRRSRGDPYGLLFKYSDIVSVFAFFNLIAYIVMTIRDNSVWTDIIYLHWDRGFGLSSRSNFLNLTALSPLTHWMILGINLLRNLGIFPEPLMYVIPLITSLSTELFLRDKNDMFRIWKCILLSAAIFSSQSSLGIMLLSVVLGIHIMRILVARKNWTWMALLLILTISICGFIFFQKKTLYYSPPEDSTESLSSMDVHFDDYRLGIKAFLDKPLVGGGYDNIEYIQSFMSEYRYNVNRGFSNSVTLVLGECGLMLSTLCLIPFLLCFLELRKGRDKSLAFWMIGPSSLYFLTIIHFHLYMIMIMAVGYSVLGVKKNEESNCYERNAPSETAKRTQSIKHVLPMVICALLLIAFGKPVWNGLYRFLRSNQLSMAQSVCRAFCLDLILIFNGMMIKGYLSKTISPKRFIVFVVYEIVYTVLYPIWYSFLNTFLDIIGIQNTKIESLLLLFLWMIIPMMILAINPANWTRQKYIIVPAAALTGVLMAVIATDAIYSFSHDTPELNSKLNRLTEKASGKVFVNDIPAVSFFHNPGISLSAAKDEGFDAYDNATIIFRKGFSSRELISKGYEVAELTPDHDIYTNDKVLIDNLSSEGTKFYRYYPYAVEVIPDAEYELFPKGKYDLVYQIKATTDLMDKTEPDDTICSINATDLNGDTLLIKDVKASVLEENGSINVDTVLDLESDAEEIVFSIKSVPGYEIEVDRITARQIPDSITLYNYNSYGEVIREEYYNTDSTPHYDPKGFCIKETMYDIGGRVTGVRYLDNLSDPVIITGGYAECRYTYNAKGKKTSTSYYDTEGHRIGIKTGQALEKYDYDTYGNQYLVRYYDEDAQPTKISAGYSEIKRYYDGLNRLTREEYRDESERLIKSTSGYSALEREYDDNDQIITEKYYDTNGKKINSTAGYAEVKNTYDSQGRLISKKYIDMFGKPCTENSSKISEIHYSYDDWDRIIREKYMGPDGLSANNNLDYAGVILEYDDTGLVASRKYYGTDGKPTAIYSGYAEIRYDYNKKGQNTAEWYFDISGSPVTCTDGYYGLTMEYNDDGYVSVQTCVDTNGFPMTSTSLYARSRTEYDEHGKASRIRYYDISDRLVRTTSGYSELRRDYDVWGRLSKEEYFDENGDPVSNINEVASFDREYNDRDLLAHEIRFDVFGVESDDINGISEVYRTYDDTDHLLKEERLNTNGTRQMVSGYTAILYEYDERGLISHITYVDDDNEPVILADGYAAVEYEYDEMRNAVSDKYLDIKNNYVNTVLGYAGIKRTYKGRLCLEENFINSRDALTDSSKGYCSMTREYDEDRNLISVTYKDRSGKPAINNSVGYATVKYEYDDIRNRTAEYYYDADGSPICDVDGVASVRYTYDKYRNRTEEHLDVTGSPVDKLK